MKIPLSQEYIHMPEEDIRCLTEVIYELVTSGHSSIQVNSLDMPKYDLQHRKVISPSSELRFGCSWTLRKYEENIRCLIEVIDDLVTSGHSSIQVSSSDLPKYDL